MTEREGSPRGAAARELLIDRPLPWFGEPGYGKVATSFLVCRTGPGVPCCALRPAPPPLSGATEHAEQGQ
jgi:hypothetical protein